MKQTHRALFLYMRQQLATTSPCEMSRFDTAGLMVFEQLLRQAKEDPTLLCSVRELADACASTRGAVTRRLQTLACYGLITVHADWGPIGNLGMRRACSRVRFNPVAAEMLATKEPNVRRAWAKRLLELGLMRAHSARPMQGFNSHVPFGQPEPVLPPGLQVSGDVGGELFNLAAEASKLVPEKEAKRAKEAERMERRARHQAWVERAGKMWTVCQVNAGRMKANDPLPPAWAVSDKGVHKKERDELTQLLERYGGARTGMAWMLFTSSNAKMKDDRPEFRIDIPFVQYVSVDKKPTQFAKHFSAILGNARFQQWENDATMVARVVHYFGELATYSPLPAEPPASGASTPTPTLAVVTPPAHDAWARQGASQ